MLRPSAEVRLRRPCRCRVDSLDAGLSRVKIDCADDGGAVGRGRDTEVEMLIDTPLMVTAPTKAAAVIDVPWTTLAFTVASDAGLARNQILMAAALAMLLEALLVKRDRRNLPTSRRWLRH